jgi:TolB protein
MNHIFVMDADGNNVKRLTHEGEDYEPTWSPNGKKIAFRRKIDGEPRQIFLMNADGSNQINLTNNPSKDGGPTWSPDGKKIAFNSNRDIPRGWPYHLHVMDADGSNVQVVSQRETSYAFPAWSPDGKKIACTGFPDKSRRAYEIFVYNFETGNDSQLTALGGLNTYVAWSSDGKKITFQHYEGNRSPLGNLYIMDADGSNQQEILLGEAFLGDGGGQPAWKPR